MNLLLVQAPVIVHVLNAGIGAYLNGRIPV